jgi:hypothetical protein
VAEETAGAERMRKVRAEYSLRQDGKYNIWRKIDVLPDRGEDFSLEKHSLGDWVLVDVVANAQAASERRCEIVHAG